MKSFDELLGVYASQQRLLQENLRLLDEIEAHALWPTTVGQTPDLKDDFQAHRHDSEEALEEIRKLQDSSPPAEFLAKRFNSAVAETYIAQVENHTAKLRRMLSQMNQAAGIPEPQSAETHRIN